MPKKNSKADRALLAKAEDQVKSDDAGSKPVADPDSEPRSAADVAADFGVPVDWALRWLECVEPQADDERKWRTDVFQRRFQGSRKVENERLQLRQQLDELKADMAKQAADFRDALKAKDKQLEKQEASFEEERVKFKEVLRSKVIKNVELASSIGEERRAFQEDMQKKDAEIGELRRKDAKLEQALRDKDEECAHRIADLEAKLDQHTADVPCERPSHDEAPKQKGDQAELLAMFEEERQKLMESMHEKEEEMAQHIATLEAEMQNLRQASEQSAEKVVTLEEQCRTLQQDLQRKEEEMLRAQEDSADPEASKEELALLQAQMIELEKQAARSRESLEELKMLRLAKAEQVGADNQRPPDRVEEPDLMEKRKNFSYALLPDLTPEASDAETSEEPTLKKVNMQRCGSISALELVCAPDEKAQSRQQERRRMAPRYESDSADVPVVIVASEIAPWSKTGGLGMVTASFAYEFAARGRRTMSVAPMYREYAGLTLIGEKLIWAAGQDRRVRYFHQYQDFGNGCGCDYIFVDHECYRRPGGLYCSDVKTGKEYDDNVFRFGLFCLAALEAPLSLSIRGQAPLGQRILFVSNDWQAGLVPLYLAHKYRKHGIYRDARCVYVVHNMGYQGRYPLSQHPPGPVLGLDEAATSDLRYGGDLNLSKAALVTCDHVVTVSPTYAQEIQTPQGGFGLHEIVRHRSSSVTGILNGIDDSWDPRTDSHILCNYTNETVEQCKPRCKAALQEALGLRQDPDRPLVGFVGRLTHQKGIDLLGRVVPWLMQDTGNGVTGRVQLVMMGDGEHAHCEMLKSCENNHKGSVCGYCGFDPVLEHKMMAGCDFLIMPSRYEPCGLPQMYCQAYGTLPIVHATGGLKDSVVDIGPNDCADGATGFVFAPLTENDMKRVLYHALDIYVRRPHIFKQMQQNAMAKDFYWPQAMDQYERQIDRVMAVGPHRQS